MTRAIQLWTLLSLSACVGACAAVLVGAWRGDQPAASAVVVLTALATIVPFVVQARRDEREHARLVADLRRASSQVVSMDRALLAERVASRLLAHTSERRAR